MKLPLQRWGKQLMVFLFPAETDTWVTVLRIGLGVQVVVYSLFLGGDWHYLFSSTGKGLVSRQLGEAITAFDSPLIPKLGWLVAFGRSFNISEETVLSVAWAALLCVGFLLLLGLFCRSAAVFAWFLHLCAAESGGLLAYGADNFMTIGLFYLMLFAAARSMLTRSSACRKETEESASFSAFGDASYSCTYAWFIFSEASGNAWATAGGMEQISGDH